MSGFTSILKNIGVEAAKAALTYVGLAELGQKIFKNPTPPAGIIPQKMQDLYEAVKRAQFIQGILGDNSLTGVQKRAMVIPEFTAAFLAIDDFRGHKPEDEEAFKNYINQMVDAFVGAANQFKK